jgi:hypothetical protein
LRISMDRSVLGQVKRENRSGGFREIFAGI